MLRQQKNKENKRKSWEKRKVWTYEKLYMHITTQICHLTQQQRKQATFCCRNRSRVLRGVSRGKKGGLWSGSEWGCQKCSINNLCWWAKSDGRKVRNWAIYTHTHTGASRASYAGIVLAPSWVKVKFVWLPKGTEAGSWELGAETGPNPRMSC